MYEKRQVWLLPLFPFPLESRVKQHEKMLITSIEYQKA
jgi:hypothetical protein